jgi:hypothetical protein
MPNIPLSGDGTVETNPKSITLLKLRNVGHKKHAQPTGL